MTLKGESLLPFISSDMTFTRWRTAAISKMVFHYKLSRPISIQFGYADPNYYFENGHWWKIKFCQIQDGKQTLISAISQHHIVRLVRNLERESTWSCWHVSHHQNSKFRKFTMADRRILKIRHERWYSYSSRTLALARCCLKDHRSWLFFLF